MNDNKKQLKHMKQVMTPFGMMENHSYTPNKSNINYDKLTPYDRKRLEGKGCPPSP